MKDKPKKFIIFLLLFISLWFLRVLLFQYLDSKIEDDHLASLTSAFFKLLIWVLPAVAFLIVIDKTNPLKFLKFTSNVGKGLRWSLVLIVLGIIYQVVIVYFKLDIFKFNFPGFISTVIFTPVLEETLSRGFIYNKLREITSEWKANLVQSVLFVYIHIPGWIILQNISAKEAIISIISIFVLSLLLGLLVKKTNSIYPAIVLHAINNWISAL